MHQGFKYLHHCILAVFTVFQVFHAYPVNQEHIPLIQFAQESPDPAFRGTDLPVPRQKDACIYLMCRISKDVIMKNKIIKSFME